MIKSKDYLTSFEAAKVVGVTPDYIRRLIAQGKLKAEKLGHNWLIKPSALKRITRQRQRKQQEQADGSCERNCETNSSG